MKKRCISLLVLSGLVLLTSCEDTLEEDLELAIERCNIEYFYSRLETEFNTQTSVAYNNMGLLWFNGKYTAYNDDGSVYEVLKKATISIDPDRPDVVSNSTVDHSLFDYQEDYSGEFLCFLPDRASVVLQSQIYRSAAIHYYLINNADYEAIYNASCALRSRIDNADSSSSQA